MKALLHCLTLRAICNFLSFLTIYLLSISYSHAQGFVDVSGLSVSELPVIIGKNFNIKVLLKEYHSESKSFEYIEAWMQDKNRKDIYIIERWNNVFFNANETKYFSTTTYIDPAKNRLPGDYFIIIRGKLVGGKPFNLGVVPESNSANPYKFSAINPIKEASIVFSNYGPGDSFGLCDSGGCYMWSTGLNVNNPKQSIRVGMPFTVPWGINNFKLNTVTVTAFQLAPIYAASVYTVSINEDVRGLPGKTLEEFTFNFDASTNFLNPILLTGVSSRNPTLYAGTQYWLTTNVKNSSRMLVGWPQNNQGSTGLVSQSLGGYSWDAVNYKPLGVFRITGNAAPDNRPTVYLLLHGLNSGPKTWDKLVENGFTNKCITLEFKDVYIKTVGSLPIPKSTCYRYHFKSRSVNGNAWPNGDGANYLELGDEVSKVVFSIGKSVNPKAIILIGHSRGGLAARAFLQDFMILGFGITPTYKPGYKIGLLTIGTPHQGSPFGRIKHWMDIKGYGPSDIPSYLRSSLRFIFSPSVGYLATDHDENGNAVYSEVSQEIWNLNSIASSLSNNVAVFGQIVSYGLTLGENMVGGLNIFDGASSAKILPGDYNDLKKYVLANIATVDNDGKFCSEQDKSNSRHWACNSDGLVPFISQRLSALPGFNQEANNVISRVLPKTTHDDETRQYATIIDTLKMMTKEDGFTPFK